MAKAEQTGQPIKKWKITPTPDDTKRMIRTVDQFDQVIPSVIGLK